MFCIVNPNQKPRSFVFTLQNCEIEIKQTQANIYRESQVVDEESSYSSFYSSFLKTDTGSGSNDDSNNADTKAKSDDVTYFPSKIWLSIKEIFLFQNKWQKSPQYPQRKRDPPWLETVSVTPELIYRYQMSIKGIEDILEADLNTLNKAHQVNSL